MFVFYEFDYNFTNWNRGCVCEFDDIECLDGANAFDKSFGRFVYFEHCDCDLLWMEPRQSD